MDDMQERALFDFVEKYTACTPDLRDQFAMAALTGELASQDYLLAQGHESGWANENDLAERVWQVADAIMKAKGDK